MFFFKQGLGYYSEDIKVSSFAKYFKSELQDALDIKIEKIVIEKSASSNEHKVHLYGSNLPSKKDCEVRTVTIKEWGYPSTQFSITKVGNPYSCADGSVLEVAGLSGGEAEPLTSTAQVGTTQSGSVQAVRDILFTFESKSKKYTLERLKPEQASSVFMLMSTRPAQTTDHPVVDNPHFANAAIVEEKDKDSIYPVTTLRIGNISVLSSGLESGDYMLEYIGAIVGESDILLAGAFGGGNSCDTSTQMIISDQGGGNYSVSKQFGRCSPSIWRQNDAVYFIYNADEYYPLEILALTSLRK